MTVMIKRLCGCGLAAMCIASLSWAGEAGDAGLPSPGQCQERAGNGVHASPEIACMPNRFPRKLQGSEQRARGRDALLQYRSGEHRPRMVRAALDLHSDVLSA